MHPQVSLPKYLEINIENYFIFTDYTEFINPNSTIPFGQLINTMELIEPDVEGLPNTQIYVSKMELMFSSEDKKQNIFALPFLKNKKCENVTGNFTLYCSDGFGDGKSLINYISSFENSERHWQPGIMTRMLRYGILRWIHPDADHNKLMDIFNEQFKEEEFEIKERIDSDAWNKDTSPTWYQ